MIDEEPCIESQLVLIDYWPNILHAWIDGSHIWLTATGPPRKNFQGFYIYTLAGFLSAWQPPKEILQ